MRSGFFSPCRDGVVLILFWAARAQVPGAAYVSAIRIWAQTIQMPAWHFAAPTGGLQLMSEMYLESRIAKYLNHDEPQGTSSCWLAQCMGERSDDEMLSWGRLLRGCLLNGKAAYDD